MAGTLEVPAEGSPNTSEDPKVKAAIKAYNESLGAGNKLEGKEIVAGSIPSAQFMSGVLGRWYTPVVTATEQERENVAFGTLTTADEVKSVVLPANGLIVIGYQAAIKSTVSEAGRAAIFLGANQLKIMGGVGGGSATVQEAKTLETTFRQCTTSGVGLTATGSEPNAVPTTGILLAGNASGGLCYVYAEAGTYNVSVQFKASSGKVIAKERKLWVGVVGV